MLDNPEKTARLLDALKRATPFEVELMPMVVKQLQADKVAAANQPLGPEFKAFLASSQPNWISFRHRFCENRIVLKGHHPSFFLG